MTTISMRLLYYFSQIKPKDRFSTFKIIYHNIYPLALIFFLSVIFPVKVFAHPDKETHAKEIMAAIGFEYNDILSEWLCFISSEMIDSYLPALKQIQNIYPNFTISPPREHRCFFHWNYNGKPWSKDLDRIVIRNAKKIYGEKYRDSIQLMSSSIFNILVKEQKERNKLINSKTENILGFASGGKDASYANYFAAMAYDLHILGDYTSSDNTILTGLIDFNILVNGITSTINRLDYKEGKTIVKAIRRANGSNKTVQYRADDVMEVILNMLPLFTKKALGGTLKRRLEKRGFKFLE